MIENRKALTIVIGYIIGIIMGLYCKINIVFFYAMFYLLSFIYRRQQDTKFKLFSFKRYIRYVKIVFNHKVMKIIIIFSVISNTIVLFQNDKYDNLYKNLEEQNCKLEGIVLSGREDKYKVKVINPTYKNTNLYIYLKDNMELEYGDKIIFSGEFSKPKKCSNYKGFDSSSYLKTLKIYGTVKIDDIKVVAKDKGNIVLKYTNRITHKIKQKIQETGILSENEKSILEGILLGDKTEISEEILDNFSSSNISYVLAVSGMHVSYMILFSNFIFNKIFGKHHSKMISSLIILIYMGIANFTPSVVRASITGIIATMSNFFYRKNDVWEALSLALLIILMDNPFLILNIGLQLSFAGTLGIIIFQKNFKKWGEDWLDRANRRAIRKNKKFTKWIIKKINSKIGELVINNMLVTFSATIMVIPVLVISFHTISISGFLISILTSFVIGPIVILGVIFTIFNINIIGIVLKCFLELLIWFANLGSKLPLNQIYLVTPSIFQILVYYSFIFILNWMIHINLERNPSLFQRRIKNLISFFKYKIKTNKKRVISILLIFTFFYSLIVMIPKDLKIYFIDVGQGDCTLIVTPRNQTILIDGGGNEWGDFDVRRKNTDAIFVR